MLDIDFNITLDQLERGHKISLDDIKLYGDDVYFYHLPTYGQATDTVQSGYFATEKSVYSVISHSTELVILVSGEVEITNELTGMKKLYKAGDSWFIEQGIPTLWDVKSDYFIKYYLGVDTQAINILTNKTS